MDSLEEFPPTQRRPPAKQARQGGQSSRVSGGMHYVVWLVVAGAAVAGAYFWMHRRISEVESNLAEATATLADAGGSLRLLWTTTTKLDESQAERQDLLQDSLGLVKNYVESEVNKLWETAYRDHERRLNQSAERIRDNDESIRRLVNATGRTNATLDALINQNRVLQQNLNSVSQAATALRQTLVTLTGQLDELQGQLTAARTAQAALVTRMEGVELWVGEFRSERLDAGTVRDRLAALVADLRAVTVRVDSLRTRTDSTRSVRAR